MGWPDGGWIRGGNARPKPQKVTEKPKQAQESGMWAQVSDKGEVIV